MPVDDDAKTLPFGEAEPGATGLELLLPVALHWAASENVPLRRALAVATSAAAGVLGHALGPLQASVGRLVEGGVGDLCIVEPDERFEVVGQALVSQGKYTPFEGHALPGRVRCTVVAGQTAFER